MKQANNIEQHQTTSNNIKHLIHETEPYKTLQNHHLHDPVLWQGLVAHQGKWIHGQGWAVFQPGLNRMVYVWPPGPSYLSRHVDQHPRQGQQETRPLQQGGGLSKDHNGENDGHLTTGEQLDTIQLSPLLYSGSFIIITS